MKHRGVLGAYGYRHVASKTPKQRRAALSRAAKALGWLYLVRKLNALYVFNKHRHPDLAARFMANRQFASAKHRVEAVRLHAVHVRGGKRVSKRGGKRGSKRVGKRVGKRVLTNTSS